MAPLVESTVLPGGREVDQAALEAEAKAKAAAEVEARRAAEARATPAKTGTEGDLQQRYISLLEKRIGQLEAAINKTEESDKKDEKKDDDKKDETKTRYVNALREWDKASAAYKDEIVAESSLKKEAPKDVAYLFRRVVYDTYSGEKRAFSELEIEDKDLIRLLKSEIDNKYPGVNFDGGRIYMQAPFPAIIHNWDKLCKRAEQDPDSQVGKDLTHLLERIRTAEELEDYFKTREANDAGKVTTFETLWTVFAPKTLVVVKPFMGTPLLLQVEQSPIPYSRQPIKTISKLHMVAWSWDYNGKKMVKVRYLLKFKRFRGTKDVSDMDFFPLKYYNGEGGEEGLRKQIRERSAKVLRATLFCKGGADQMARYEGNAYMASTKIVSVGKDDDDDEDDMRRNNEEEDTVKAKLVPIKGDIICDAQAYLQYAHPTRIHALGEWEQFHVEEPATEIEDIFRSLTLEDVETGASETVEDSDYLIIPPRVLGYSTKEKQWGQFFVDYKAVPSGKAPRKFHEDLQLDKKYKNLIEALVESHEANVAASKDPKKARQVEDMVHDKGKGLVLLLHGPPGVGKTLTAETIAEATGKPLFVVSVAEIGLDASRAEKNLEKLFNLATKWEAILLVDEADVFLETRGSTSDASRNALVSVLLRVLEYYKGIIILTTNRIKSIDVAVISRIHLAIRYSDLTDLQMKNIFKYFLDQLEPEDINDRPQIDAFIDNTGHHYGLNGRQIRNVVAAALAAARHSVQTKGEGDGRLTEEHLRRVCEMTRDFQEQLKDHAMAQRYQNEATGGYGGGYRR